MYLTLGKNNPAIAWIKKELIRDGNQPARELYQNLPEEFDISERTFIQYVSYVKTQLLEKHVTFTDKENLNNLNERDNV